MVKLSILLSRFRIYLLTEPQIFTNFQFYYLDSDLTPDQPIWSGVFLSILLSRFLILQQVPQVIGDFPSFNSIIQIHWNPMTAIRVTKIHFQFYYLDSAQGVWVGYLRRFLLFQFYYLDSLKITSYMDTSQMIQLSILLSRFANQVKGMDVLPYALPFNSIIQIP